MQVRKLFFYAGTFAVIFISLFMIGNSITGDFLNLRSFETSRKIVTKVIDGDTVIAEGERVRLLGIDTDERGYPCYEEAKKKLEEYVLGKEVRVMGGKEDQYGRELAYLFLNDTNINLEMVRQGMAVSRFSGDTRFKEEIKRAEEKARREGRGCKWGSGSWLSEGSKEEREICQIEKKVGVKMTLKGEIVDFYKNEDAVFLNFGSPYPNSCFTAVIWSEDWGKFPELAEENYRGRKVRITGEIKEHQGEKEMVLDKRDQLNFM